MRNCQSTQMKCLRCDKVSSINATGVCVDCRKRACETCGKEFVYLVRNAAETNCTRCRHLSVVTRLKIKASGIIHGEKGERMRQLLLAVIFSSSLVGCFWNTEPKPTPTSGSGGGSALGTFHQGPYCTPEGFEPHKCCNSPGGYCEDDKHCHSSKEKCKKQ